MNFHCGSFCEIGTEVSLGQQAGNVNLYSGIARFIIFPSERLTKNFNRSTPNQLHER